MELAFATLKLRSVCEDEGKATQLVGIDVQQQFMRRLADLRAAQSLGDIVAGRPTISGSTVTFELANGFVLVCRFNHARPPIDLDGELDWGRIRRLQVTDIKKLEADD